MEPLCTWNPPLDAARAELPPAYGPAHGPAEAVELERARSDPEAFADLYRRHYPAVARCVLRRVDDRATAEELVSDVFFAALRALPRYRSRGVPVRHWLLRITVRAVSRRARDRRRFARALAGAHEREHDRRGDDRVEETAAPRVRAALATLPTRQQEVLTLHHLEGLSVRAVARALSCREGTVKSRLARAREAFGRKLENMEKSES